MAAKSDEMLVAKESFVTEGGAAYIKNVTRVRAGDPVVKKFKDLFQPLDVSYPAVETATAAPGEERGEASKSESKKTEGLTTDSLKGG